MKAVILAGGLATRLQPLSHFKPKSLVEIGGRPLLEHLILLCKSHGFKEIIISGFYQVEKIIDYFADGSRWGVSLEYSFEKGWPQGTAGSLRKAEHLLKGQTFLVLNGDALTDVDLYRMLNFHREKGGLATLFVHPTDHPHDSDLVEFGEDFLVTRIFRTNPGENFEPIGKTGTIFLEPRVLSFIPRGQTFSLERELIPLLVSRGESLYAYYSNDYSKDMGTWERLQQVRDDVSAGRVKIATA